jgi:hypothetical protein
MRTARQESRAKSQSRVKRNKTSTVTEDITKTNQNFFSTKLTVLNETTKKVKIYKNRHQSIIKKNTSGTLQDDIGKNSRDSSNDYPYTFRSNSAKPLRNSTSRD